MPILTSKMNYNKWIVGYSNLEYFLGTYEYKKRILFEKKPYNLDIVYDVGANVRFYTLLDSKIVGKSCKVITFEPLPKNIKFLQKYLIINNTDNVEVIKSVVLDHFSSSLFKETEFNSIRQIDVNGEIDLNTISIAEFVKNYPTLKPYCIKIDVEGAEMIICKEGISNLKKHHLKIFLETYSDPLNEKYKDVMKELGYKIDYITQKDEIYVYYNDMVDS